MKTTDKGINYAGPFSHVNQDKDTGIRYGVISQHAIGQAWYDAAEADYGLCEESICPKCAANNVHDDEKWGNDVTCPHCSEVYTLELLDYCEPLAFTVETEEITATCEQDSDIFILKSEYFTYAQFCSPCAPGACYLENWLEASEDNKDNKAYCFGPDWFDEECPYPVYSVKTGERIK